MHTVHEIEFFFRRARPTELELVENLGNFMYENMKP